MTIDGIIDRQRVIVWRFSRESGRNGEGGKSHALSNKPTLISNPDLTLFDAEM